MRILAIVLVSLIALLPLAVSSYAQESTTAASSITAGETASETSDVMAAQYTEALTMLYAWGAIREDFLKHPEEPASPYDVVYTMAPFMLHFFPESYADFWDMYHNKKISFNGMIDPPRDDWSFEMAEFLGYCGIFSSASSDSFGGEQPICRYEVALVFARAQQSISEGISRQTALLSEKSTPAKSCSSIDSIALSQFQFADVPSQHWSFDAITYLCNSGVLIDEFGDSSFRGDENITRSSLALWLYRLADALDLEDFVETEPVLTPTYNGGSGCGG